MKMTNKEYGKYVEKKTPNSNIVSNLFKAFAIGGLICAAGQGILDGYILLGLEKADAATWTSVTLVFIGALLTGLNVYDNIARHGGAGTLVPITGFANAVVSPALEFKSEGFVTGTSSKMFIIAGPVIVYGISASVIYGLILAMIT